VGDKIFSLVLAVVILAVGGYAIARTMHHTKTVAPATRRAMVAAVLQKAPGAAVMSSQCGSSSCTIYVRKGATHACDGWMASLDENGGIALVGVGTKKC
jgi:hypothetical protein